MFKVNNKTPEERHWSYYNVFIVNFKHIRTFFSISIPPDFEHVNVN